jgi:two-component system OmpR family sensor kinase
MKNSLILLDKFIKDTTHELNTPLSAVLANIEMMNTETMSASNLKKLNRINIGAKSLSILYKDLTYLTLEQERENVDELFDVKSLIMDRIDYFNILMKSKNITYKLNLDKSTICIDKKKFTRVIDNLISNAIKYNRRNGEIDIYLRPNKLSIKDNGIGIEIDKIPFVFDRYSRFNDSEGGFGVGLNIVKSILDEYSIGIEVKSKEGQCTEILLNW